MNPGQASVLREMGLAPLWRLRDRPAVDDPTPAEGVELAPAPNPEPVTRDVPKRRIELPRTAPATAPIETPAAINSDQRAGRIAELDWDALEADIRSCTACRLCEQRQQAVPGSGDRNARIMFVGEGPGAEEDRRGVPFVGAAGTLLDAMLDAIGLSRENGVYIANTVKCRPPHNRTPQADEMAACKPYLDRQIELVRPGLLVALGRPAAQVLLDQNEVRINAARGRELKHGDIPLLVTYHPAYLLRNPQDKARVWEDLCRLRRLLSTRSPSD